MNLGRKASDAEKQEVKNNLKGPANDPSRR
jgi:hypothetical protein